MNRQLPGVPDVGKLLEKLKGLMPLGRDDHQTSSMRNATERADSEDPLCEKFPGHMMCNPKVGPKCIESENGRGFTKAEQKQMIKLHNQLRRKVQRDDQLNRLAD